MKTFILSHKYAPSGRYIFVERDQLPVRLRSFQLKKKSKRIGTYRDRYAFLAERQEAMHEGGKVILVGYIQFFENRKLFEMGKPTEEWKLGDWIYNPTEMMGEKLRCCVKPDKYRFLEFDSENARSEFSKYFKEEYKKIRSSNSAQIEE